MLRNFTISALMIATLASASVVSRQDSSLINSLSSSCQTTLKGLLTAPEAECLNLGSFLSSAVASNKTVPDIADSWLTGLCALGSCSDANIASVVTTVAQGCSTDLNNAGITSLISTDQMVSFAQQFYPSARQVACLKDDSANKLCVPSTLSSVESIIGPLSVSMLNVDSLTQNGEKLLSNLKSFACTGCVKQAYNIISKVFPSQSILGVGNSELTDSCGASFIDGSASSGISQTAQAGSFVATKPSSAVGLNARNVAGGALAMAATSFVFAILV
ncbi:hypothetical protein CPC08DRAFT_759446 [Agrocybe pediades]|nr:hypothetical protein CPC08DRAFT_759446 [Agrocybe pediades]